MVICSGFRTAGCAALTFVEEVLSQLCARETEEAAFLLEGWDFWIFPMMNPDGYELGNSSVNAAGADLTQASTLSVNLHPENICLVKKLREIQSRQNIEMIFEVGESVQSLAHSITGVDSNRLTKDFACYLSELCSNFDIAASQVGAPSGSFLERLRDISSFVMNLELASGADKYGVPYSAPDFKKLAKDFLYLLGLFLSANKELKSLDLTSQSVRKFLTISEPQIGFISKASANIVGSLGTKPKPAVKSGTDLSLPLLKQMHGDSNVSVPLARPDAPQKEPSVSSNPRSISHRPYQLHISRSNQTKLYSYIVRQRNSKFFYEPKPPKPAHYGLKKKADVPHLVKNYSEEDKRLISNIEDGRAFMRIATCNLNHNQIRETV